MKSIWSDKIKMPEFESLCNDIHTDVLIIGGGICGILCAYFLKNAGVDYTLVEGSKIASGATKNTTAKITSLHGLVYDKLIKSSGKERAKAYLCANENAIRRYEEICTNIDCDFEKKRAYTYSQNNRRKIEDEVEAINSLGFSAKFLTHTELPFEVSGAVCMENQAQFNPLKFIADISRDLNIYEDTFINEITPKGASSEHAKITAEKIIVTTHFPFINKHGSYFIKLYQQRSYVLALENAQKLDGMYLGADDDALSFRDYKGVLLLGGGGHRTGKKGGNWRALKDFCNIYYPDSKILYEWAAQDCMSLDSIPYIGQYSVKTPNLYVASGFNKWGMTSSMLAAEILCDLIMGKKNEFSQSFSPSRSIMKPQLFINGFETLSNFVLPTTKRCPHLGCALKWNSAEHSWDCPCHGSRFNKDGILIDNPATGNANVDK